MPIMRTTAKYKQLAQWFRDVHNVLAEQIRTACGLGSDELNNALMHIETYTSEHAKMGFHSDQALELADNSTIAVFSCYEHPELTLTLPPRKLVIVMKAENGAGGGQGGQGGQANGQTHTAASTTTFEIPLPHNSAVVFSTATNRRFQHKIVPGHDASTSDGGGTPPENRWLGVTLRTSKTYMRYQDTGSALSASVPAESAAQGPFFEDGSVLALANEEQTKGFYGLRREENNRTDFWYHPLSYTISVSDLQPPGL